MGKNTKDKGVSTLSRRRFLTTATSFFVGSYLTGCQLRHQPLLRVASGVWLGYEPMFLARKYGWIDDRSIRLIETRSTSEALRLLYAGRVEGAALTLDEVLTAQAQGVPLEIALIFDFSRGADVLLAHPDIPDLFSLANRRVGVETTAVGAVMLSAALERAHLTSKDIILVPLHYHEHREAYLKGRVDALVTFEPTASLLEAEGANRLFDSQQIPDRIMDVLAFRPEALPILSGAARRLIAAHFRAVDRLRTAPRATVRDIQQRLELTETEILKAYQGIHLPGLEENRQWLMGSPPPLERQADKLQALMLKHQLISRPVAVTGLATASLLET
ncbi:MAG: ABC transporter substrate-binding protein [Methylohalobius sp. ZOD2]